MIPAARLRPHPVCVKTHTRCASPETPEAEPALPPTLKATGVRQRPRSVSGVTLVQWVPLTREFLVRHRARCSRALTSDLDRAYSEIRPKRIRRDMLNAHLYYALSHAGVSVLPLKDSVIDCVAVEDDEFGHARLVIRAKRGRKAST